MSTDLFKREFNVLSTDYDNYAVVYSCQTFDQLKVETGSILSRKAAMEPEFLELAQKEVDDFGLEYKRFRAIDQKNCD